MNYGPKVPKNDNFYTWLRLPFYSLESNICRIREWFFCPCICIAGHNFYSELHTYIKSWWISTQIKINLGIHIFIFMSLKIDWWQLIGKDFWEPRSSITLNSSNFWIFFWVSKLLNCDVVQRIALDTACVVLDSLSWKKVNLRHR